MLNRRGFVTSLLSFPLLALLPFLPEKKEKAPLICYRGYKCPLKLVTQAHYPGHIWYAANYSDKVIEITVGGRRITLLPKTSVEYKAKLGPEFQTIQRWEIKEL